LESSVEVSEIGTDTDVEDTGDAPFTIQTVKFAPGDTQKTVTFSVSGDIDVEPDETIIMQLKNPSNASIDPEASTAEGR
jgi:hypothetical protein